jgi:hypothetical protein
LRIAAALGQRQHQKLCGERSFEKMVRNQVALPGIAAPPRQSARSEEIDRALQLRTARIDYDTPLA